MAHKQFRLKRKPINERTKIKRLKKNKNISIDALKQLDTLLLLDNQKESIADIAAYMGVGTKTVTKWRNLFSEIGFDSLLVYIEKAEKKKTCGKMTVTLKNGEVENQKLTNDKEKKEDESKSKNENKNEPFIEFYNVYQCSSFFEFL